ncbi:MAG: outer membrane beta-barrel protein [Candidatus Marinimicrobia bacterium]|jgi:hypothetical protein|nr:outer membrane beta-barrel protein [Candidatus Neomarinimicrobiota bacterium]
MKRMLIILSLASCMFAGEMGLKAYGGLVMANVAFGEEMCDEGCTQGMKPGASFGVQYTKLPVMLGLGMSMRGTTMTYEFGDEELVMTMALNYLDITALYPYPVGPGVAFAGLDIGMLLSATASSDAEGSEDVDLTEDDGTNSLDYGIMLGYTYPINDDMSVSLGYYMGLGDVTGDYGLDEDPSADKNTGLFVNMGYSLPF